MCVCSCCIQSLTLHFSFLFQSDCDDEILQDYWTIFRSQAKRIEDQEEFTVQCSMLVSHLVAAYRQLYTQFSELSKTHKELRKMMCPLHLGFPHAAIPISFIPDNVLAATANIPFNPICDSLVRVLQHSLRIAMDHNSQVWVK